MFISIELQRVQILFDNYTVDRIVNHRTFKEDKEQIHK